MTKLTPARITEPSQALVDAVAKAIAAAWAWPEPSWEDIARAAVAAVQANETCARCGAALAVCAECVADNTDSIGKQI